jgi:hypothetical protein
LQRLHIPEAGLQKLSLQFLEHMIAATVVLAGAVGAVHWSHNSGHEPRTTSP